MTYMFFAAGLIVFVAAGATMTAGIVYARFIPVFAPKTNTPGQNR